jgi:hypothetical protein
VHVHAHASPTGQAIPRRQTVLRSKAPKCPKTPSPADLLGANICTAWQFRMAHYLAYNGLLGSFLIDNSLRDWVIGTGEIMKLAMRAYDDSAGYYWQVMHCDSKSLEPQGVHDLCGTPLHDQNGSFAGLRYGKRVICPRNSIIRADRRAAYQRRCVSPRSALRGQDPMWF